MRLFLVSILFVFVVYCVTNAKATKCNEYSVTMENGQKKKNEKDGGKKDCNGACLMKLKVNGKGEQRSMEYILQCANKPREDAKKNPCAKNSDGYYDCYCFADLCFTKEMTMEYLKEFGQTGKVTLKGESSEGKKAAGGDAKPAGAASQGSTVFSSSFVFFSAVLVLSFL